MMSDYAGGDPYVLLGRRIGLIPPDGTRYTHPAERERMKALAFMTNYHCGPDSIARKFNEPTEYGRQILSLHRMAYPDYWEWAQNVEDHANLYGKLTSPFGWQLNVFGPDPDPNPRSLKNWPVQCCGADMMRLAAIQGTESGVRVCCSVHDGFLIEAPADEIDEAVRIMKGAMLHAGEEILGGFQLRTDAKVWKWPDRFSDGRGREVWERVSRLANFATCGRSTSPPVGEPSHLLHIHH